MELPEEDQIKVAQELVAAAIDALKDERGVHAETAIAGTARMAGTFLFRSFGFPLDDAKPGQPVLSEEANNKGPRLMNILGGVLDQMGIAVDSARVAQETPPDHRPRLDFLQTQRSLEPKFAAIVERSDLSLMEASDAAAIATALLITQCKEILDPTIAFGIALYGFVEGTKTFPAPYKP